MKNKAYKCNAKVYSVALSDLPNIKAMFYGWIFNRTENGVGYVKCNDKDANRIRNANFLITEVK